MSGVLAPSAPAIIPSPALRFLLPVALGERVVYLVPLALLCIVVGGGAQLLGAYCRAEGEVSPRLLLGFGVWLVAVELCLLLMATAMTVGGPAP